MDKVIKGTKIRAEIERIYSKDKDKTRKIEMHSKQHEVTDIHVTRTKKQKQRATRTKNWEQGISAPFCSRNIRRDAHI